MKYIHRHLILIFCLILCLSTAACTSEKQPQRYSTDILGSFDTVISIIAYCDSDDDFNKMKQFASERFQELHQLFDLYHAYPDLNNVNSINAQAGMQPVQVDPALIELIELSRKWYDESPGVTNIALGPVLKIWHDYRNQGLSNPEAARLPDPAELAAADLSTRIDLIEVNAEAGTVFLPDKSMRIDLGATAKGYATELVCSELQEMGYRSFIISSGGNVRTVGQPLDPQRSKWGIGIQNPDPAASSSDPILDTAFVTDISIVTSGDYQRYYVVDGKQYHHIIDPKTLFPGDYFMSVTVSADDSGWADFLSTTLFLLPYDEGRAYIESIAGSEALWVFPDGKIKATDGMAAMLKEMGGAENPPPPPG